MRGLIKKLLILCGICFVITPFVLPFITTTNPSPSTAITTATIKKSPYPPSTYVTRGQQLYDQAHSATDPKQTATLLRTSLETINEGLMLYQDSAALLGLRGSVYADLIGTIPDAHVFAMSDFANAFARDTTNVAFAKKAAALALQYKEYDRAIAVLQQAQNTHPNDPEILMDLAQAQTTAGLLEQAISSYTKLLSILPSGSGAESKTIRQERDALVRLIANDLTSESSGSQQNAAIGGFDVAGANTTTMVVPDEVTLSKNPPANPFTSANGGLSGDGLLTAGTKDVTVINTNVGSTTAVYVTPTGQTNNIVLFVSSKTTGSFTVSSDESFDHDVPFKWWIK